MAGNSPWFSALEIIVMNSFFVPSHNAMQKSLPSLPFKQLFTSKQTPFSTSLASIRTAPNFLASESFPWLWGVLKWLVEHSQWSCQFFLILTRVLLKKCLQFCIFENLLSSTAMPVFDVKITVLEALKLLTTRSFTNSDLTVSIWEHSMSLSRRFLHIEAKN